MSDSVHSPYHNDLLCVSFWSYTVECTSLRHKVKPGWQRSLSWVICKVHQRSVVLLIIEQAVVQLELKALIFIDLPVRVPHIASLVRLVIVNFESEINICVAPMSISASQLN